jgi:hypothetical protein
MLSCCVTSNLKDIWARTVFYFAEFSLNNILLKNDIKIKEYDEKFRRINRACRPCPIPLMLIL